MATKKKTAAKEPRYKVAPSRKKDREARKAAMKLASGGGGKPKPKSKRLLASDYVKTDRTGRFSGFKKNVPKGYTYLPGSRYLAKTSNLRLVDGYHSAEQAKFVRQNRKLVNSAIEAASKAGAFERPTLTSERVADFDLSKGGEKFARKMQDYFHGQASSMHSQRQFGRGHAGMRRRKQWSFAFGQDGHVR